MTARAILFDCDGVLINTEEIGYRLVSQMLADQGLVYSREEYVELLSGVTYKQFFENMRADYLKRTGTDLDLGFEAEVRRRLHEIQDTHMAAIDGVAEMLAALRDAGIPFAVASNSERGNLEKKLRHTGLYDFFVPHVYSRDDVVNPKPAPDLYLYAADKLGGFAPHECLVVEDSVTGTMAGVAAAMRVIGFIGEDHRVDREADFLRAAGVSFVARGTAELQARILQLAGNNPPPPAPVCCPLPPQP